MELSFPCTFAPKNESSIDGTFAPKNFRSRERKWSGTFAPWIFRSHSQRNVVSLPNINYDYLIDKLTKIKVLYGLFVSLYSFIVVKDGGIYQIILLINLS